MSIGSIIVGQYYMSQINNQLGVIKSELDKISTFQEKEYESEIYALLGFVSKYSLFQIEIVENKELRERVLTHLVQLEYECTKLLAQANLTLKEIGKKTGLEYADYEELVIEAQTWCQYQKTLLKMLREIDYLIYALYLGKVSKDNCDSLFYPFYEMAKDAQKALETFHTETCKSLKIDLNRNWRLRSGIKRALIFVPSLFYKKLRYKGIPREIPLMISGQCSREQYNDILNNEPDLFKDKVRLIIKGGKLYYLPGLEKQNKHKEQEAQQEADMTFTIGDYYEEGPEQEFSDRFFVTTEELNANKSEADI